jgi:hypothetical protein
LVPASYPVLTSGERGTRSLVIEILNPFAIATVEQMDILSPEPEAVTTAFFKTYGAMYSRHEWNIGTNIQPNELVGA